MAAIKAPLVILLTIVTAWTGFYVGAYTVCAITTGDPVVAIVGAVALTLFGWFLFPVAALVVTGMWAAWAACPRTASAGAMFLTCSCTVNAVLFVVIGPKEYGSVALWTLAYAAGGVTAALAAGGLIILFRNLLDDGRTTAAQW